MIEFGLQPISLISTAFVNIVLALLIFIHAGKKRGEWFFGLSVFSAALWGVGHFLLIVFGDAIPGLVFIPYVSASLIVSGLVLFAVYFTELLRNRSIYVFLVGGVNIVLLLLLLGGRGLIQEAIFKENVFVGIIFGPIFGIYAAYISLLFLASFVLFFIRARKTEGLERMQNIFILAGSATSALIGMATNLFLPWAGEFRFFWLGPVFVILFTLITYYATVKHHLLNIRIISAELFTATLAFILFIRMFLSASVGEWILNSSIFGSVVLVGLFLMKSVIQEVKTREQITKLAAELQVSNEELKKLDQAKSEFISIASHQLRAPLTVIRGYVSMLLEDTYGKIAERCRGALKNVFISTEQLIKLISNMLDLSRIESGKIKYEFAKNNFEELVVQVLREFGPIAEKRGVELVFGKNTEIPPEFVFDRDKIREVVINFVDNAIKYSPDGGRVVLREELSERNGLKALRFSVSDQGIGISPDEKDKLFGKFSRTKESQKIDPGGMGIGLYFVKRVVEDHLGSVGVESGGSGRGSTFWAELPIPPEMK